MTVFGLSMATIWLIAMVVFLAIEAITVGLASIWFAVGALVAWICALLGAPIWLQIVVFIVVTAAALYFTRPIAKKYINAKVIPTNADVNIGKECRVTETIDNIAGTGAVYVGGKTWTARSADEEVIPEGALVTALRIEGVKLIVEKTAVFAEN